MKMEEFEEKVVNVLGYKSLAAFADKTKLVSRSSFSKWRNSDEVPGLMAEYINCKTAQMAKNKNSCKINWTEKQINEEHITTDQAGFMMFGEEKELNAFRVNNDWMEPEYRLGDVVLSRPFNGIVSEGYWLFEMDGKIVLGLLSMNFDGTMRLQKNLKHDTSLHFGTMHFDKIKPIGTVKYHIRKRG